MEFYNIYFAALILFNAALAYHRHQKSTAETTEAEEETLALPKDDTSKQEVKRFKTMYFGVYILVMAADWLQGPYMYTLYKDEKHLTESLTAALFTTGFVAAAITASFVGSLADKYGRKRACLTFCIAYSLSCFSVLSSDINMLFLGRALGGLSTTLLYSVFETWMIAEYHARGLCDGLRLGDMFSTSITLSGVVAILAGVVGEALVSWSGTKTAPFMLAVMCLGTAGVWIWKSWSENYATTNQHPEGHDKPAAHPSTSPSDLKSILLNKRILTLAAATTAFEGSMYLFVFFWSPALKASRTTFPLFGLIFSCFMSAMMLGSLIYPQIDLHSSRDTARLLLSVLALAASCLLVPVVAKSEVVVFWCFASFEACVGMYFPLMARLKSEVVEDGVRGRVYGLMRLPLNLFVVGALGVTREGNSHRGMVFTGAAAMLLGTFFVVQRYLM